MKKIDLKGKQFGKLKVLELAEIRKGHKYWLCQCDCGRKKIIRGSSLISGITSSCNCLRANNNKTHGKTNTRLFNIWSGMKKRCYNKNNKGYCNYGKRGISICNEWLNSFESFYEWAINNGYREDLTIDRIDNNGNYEPSNCRWTNIKTQCNNRRSNKIIEYNGEKHTISEWSTITGINKNTIWARIYKYNLPLNEVFK